MYNHMNTSVSGYVLRLDYLEPVKSCWKAMVVGLVENEFVVSSPKIHIPVLIPECHDCM